MKALPRDVLPYDRTRAFDASSVPAGLRRAHTTKAGVWGLIHVLEGELMYRIHGDTPSEHRLVPGRPGVVEPEVPHEVEPRGAVRFYVEFLRWPEGDDQVLSSG